MKKRTFEFIINGELISDKLTNLTDGTNEDGEEIEIWFGEKDFLIIKTYQYDGLIKMDYRRLSEFIKYKNPPIKTEYYHFYRPIKKYLEY